MEPTLEVQTLADADPHAHGHTHHHGHGDVCRHVSKGMPRLTPVTLEPFRQSSTAVPLAMLGQIERIEVKYTAESGGAIYFVMSVHLRHIDSRLPMSSSLLSRLRGRSGEISRPPDYHIGARFSDFAGLRGQISDLLCMNARFTCQYCEAFNEYIKFRVKQPRWIVKIGTRIDVRKSILESFINDFLNMTVQRVQADSKCQLRDKAPFIMERFLRRRYPRGQDPNAPIDPVDEAVANATNANTLAQ